jgi:hypothetical protein
LEQCGYCCHSKVMDTVTSPPLPSTIPNVWRENKKDCPSGTVLRDTNPSLVDWLLEESAREGVDIPRLMRSQAVLLFKQLDPQRYRTFVERLIQSNSCFFHCFPELAADPDMRKVAGLYVEVVDGVRSVAEQAASSVVPTSAPRKNFIVSSPTNIGECDVCSSKNTFLAGTISAEIDKGRELFAAVCQECLGPNTSRPEHMDDDLVLRGRVRSRCSMLDVAEEKPLS